MSDVEVSRSGEPSGNGGSRVFACIADLLQFYARTAPAEVAILAPGRLPLTYAELRARTINAVRDLRRLGIAPADRVAVVAPRGADSAIALLSVATAAACVPINPDFTSDELQRYFSDLKPAALVTRPDISPASRGAAHALGIPVIDLVPRSEGIGDFELVGSAAGPAVTGGTTRGEDDAFILLTSGTASRPKMVPLTHASVCLSAYNAGAVLALQPADRLLNVLPLFHAHGLISGLLTALAAGSSVILTTGFDASSFFGWLRELLPTWYTAVPTIHRALLSAADRDAHEVRPSSLRLIRSASASLAPATLKGLETLFGVPVIETYGMTEAASQIAANPRDRRKTGSVGRPAGPEIAIMDAEGRQLRSGEHGEIMLRGPTMTRGYYNDADATRSTFRGSWFRTGDLGFLDADGYLFIVGRIKDVINRGGQKVSPLEVEETLLSHQDVREAGAFAIPHKTLGENVAAVVVLRPGANVTPNQLQKFVRERLARYKVPSLIRIVPEIPKGASGKIKRNALADLLLAASGGRDQLPMPRSALEAQLAGLWTELLGVEPIGADQDVFALGADSLAVTQMLSRLRGQLGLDVSFEDIFDAPTVAALARRLQSFAAKRDVAAPISRHGPANRNKAPLSFQQQRMYILSRLDPTQYNYNVVEVACFSGALDVDALEQSLAAICRRHDVLRSTFFEAHGEPVQRTLDTIPRLERVRLGPCSERKRQSAIGRQALILARHPFDIDRGPPLRAKLLEFGKSHHALVIGIHHLATDGWSQRLFWEELAAHYAAGPKGSAALLPSPVVQYRDFAVWQQSWSQTEAAGEQLNYWRTQLEGVTTLPLRTDRPRPEIWSGRGAKHYIKLSRALSENIRSLSQARSVTPFMTLLAAFQCFLYRYTGHEDVAVGSLIANRNHIQIERLIGLFANTIVLRSDLSGDPTFGDLVRRVRQVTLDAYRNQDLPIEEVLRALRISRSRDSNPLFRVMFILQNASVEAADFPGMMTRRLDIDSGISRFDLTLELVHTDGQFSGFFEYSTDLFDACTIARMAAHLQNLLQAIVANPDQPISRLSILSPSERRRVLAGSHGLGTDFTRQGDFPGRFDQQVKRRPKAVAVSGGRRRISYRDLSARSLVIARRLTKEGAGAETVVALLAEREPNLLAAMIAAQRVGAAFLCLDPHQPANRLASILHSSGARLLLAAKSCSPMLKEIFSALPADHRPPIVKLEELVAKTPASPTRRTARAPSSLAYVIYTSGSSGIPKGVMIEQRGLSNHLASLISELRLSAADVIAQTAPQSFVISVWQFLAGLMVGARIHICANEIVRDPILLAREIDRERITVLQIVPSLLRVVLERVSEDRVRAAFSGLRLLISTGEPLTTDLCRAWFQHFPDVPLINAYGASECSDDVALHRLTATPTTGSVPIGRPLPNTQLYILDSHLQPVPAGVAGELWVGGAGVGRGYLNESALTDRRFLPDPFSKDQKARLYRTGDLARWRTDGTAECLGRIDQQVKVRGYRIELKEIEHVLLDHPDVRAAVVEPRRDAGGQIRLIAHIVAHSPPTAGALRDFLKARLPAHAIPAAFLFQEQIPLNAHGKVDRSALLAPTRAETASDNATAPARRFTEQVLSDIWSDLLKVQSVSVTDNFFDLGGHSLLAGQVMSRVARALGVSLPIKTIFEAPRVDELARRIDRALTTRSRKGPAEVQRLADDDLRPLSLAQAQMIRMERELPGLPQFNLPFALRLQGPLEVAALKQSLDEVIRRHESLRTAFGWRGNEAIPLVTAPEQSDSSLAVEDIGGGEHSREKRLRTLQLKKAKVLAEQEAWTPFDPTHAPLLRLRLLRLRANDHVLLLTIHHAIADGWSIGLLFEEISKRYSALAARTPEPAPRPAPAFSDIARWQRWWCTTESAAQQLASWRENLEGAEPIFGRDGESPQFGSPTAHEPIDLSGKLIAQLNGFGTGQNGTLFMSLLTGLKALLMLRTERHDICVATAMANRTRPNSDRVIGPFENTAIIRTRIDPELSFKQAFARVRDSVLEAYARQELPFDIVAARLEEDGIDPASLVQVYFTLQNPLRQPLQLKDVAVSPLGNVYREGQTVLPIDQTWLSLMLKERPSGITGSCSYKGELFGNGTMAQWMGDFASILAGATARPDAPLGRLLERRAA